MEMFLGYLMLVFINYWIILGCHRYLVENGTEFNGMSLLVSLLLIGPTIIVIAVVGYTLIDNLDLDYNQIFDWVLPKTDKPLSSPDNFWKDVIRDLERERCWARACNLIDKMFPNHEYTEAEIGAMVRTELDRA
jgi:hypothetical protein